MSEVQSQYDAGDLLDLFGGDIYATTLVELRYAVVEETGIDSIPYGVDSTEKWLDSGGEERILNALEAAVDASDTDRPERDST